jgi:metal-responsive CopG/Arc/MetJ family transcriptional regulator
MRTIQMTLDDSLVRAVDSVVNRLHTTRSAFTRKALNEALIRVNSTTLEEKHRNGYLLKPSSPDEFGVWENEQAWGDK